ncbi:MAG TPA: hypothetical protein VN840_13480 [Streptosporangiaceae bacterium]|nr:hypothetical protein [Streptosporangiaceae bacterium]
MSRKSRHSGLGSARDRARRAAAHVKPVAAQVKPLARSTGEAARHRVRKTRAWAAPQVERTGQVLQDTVAPKVSAVLSSAAQRLDPAEPRRRQWRKRIGAATITAAASAAAALLRSRRKPDGATPADADGPEFAAPAGAGQATTGGDAAAGSGSQVRVS